MTEQELIKKYSHYLGKRIKIVDMYEEPYANNYIGKTGLVTSIYLDPWGDVCLEGTWSSIKLYPEKDKLEILEDN